MKIIILIIIQLGTLHALSLNTKLENYLITHWNTMNGLPQNSIRSIIQDKKGYIWIGTQSGFARFDGKEFESFNKKTIKRMRSDYIVNLNTNGNKLFVATSNGLLFFNKNRLFTEKDGLYSNFITNTLIDKDKIWVATAKGLNLIQNNNIIDFKQSSFFKNKYILNLLKIKDKLLISTKDGLFLMNNNVETILYNNQKIIAPYFVKRKNGDILLGSFSKIFIYKNKEIKLFKDFNIKTLIYFFEDSNETLWITSKIKPFLIKIEKDKKIKKIELKKIIGDDIIRYFFEDKEKNLWIGTKKNGFYILNNNIFESKKYRNDFLVFRTLNQDYYNDLLKKEIKIKENNNIKILKIEQEFEYAKSILIEKNGFWLTTIKGEILFYNHKKKEITVFNNLQNKIGKHAKNILYKDSKDRLWTGDFIGNKYIIYKNNIKNVNKKYNFKDCKLHDILEFNNKIWFATDGCGIAILENEDLTYLSNNVLKTKIINSILNYNNKIWITTDNGLFFYDNKKFNKIIFEENKLNNESFYGIIIDKFQNIWVTSNSGIILIKKEYIYDFLNNSNNKIKVKLFDLSNGLKSIDFLSGQQPLVWKTKDGRLWFPSLKGLIIVDPSKINTNKLIPSIYIKNIKIDGVKYNKREKIILKPYSRKIEIKFSVLSFKNITKNKIKYKLVGYDKNWIITDKNNVTYMNLPAGDYTFKVIGSNNDGIWNLKGDNFSFKKSEYFYNKIWFRLLIFFLFLILVFILYKIRIHKIKKEKDKLSEINKKLQSVDKLKDQILANTTHELRTPLNGIIGLTEFLIDTVDDQVIKYNLSIIKNSGDRLANLINDILDFQKSKNNELKLTIKSINLYNIVESTIQLASYSLRSKNLILKNNVSKDIFLNADFERLTQILYNLIGNAIKFTSKGEVVVLAYKKDKYCEIIVRDTGIGIEKDKQEKIFNIFEQIDTRDYKHYSGTGLGLSITKELIELHGGEIKVKSNIGKGSSFIFTIPISNNKYEKSDNKKSFSYELHESIKRKIKMNSKKQYNIITIDDEMINQHILKTQLEYEGYNVIQFLNGKKALEYIKKDSKPDIILLDIMMPEISGYDVCKEIRKKYHVSELPILMLTAKVGIKDLLKGFKSGANDYIYKPFVKDELRTRIEYHLNLIKTFNNEKLELEENIEAQKEEINEQQKELKYLNNKIFSKAETELYLNRIKSYIEIEKPYKNHNFSIVDLSKNIDISIHHISQVINNYMNMNFYTFINKYRVEESIKMFNNQKFDKKTILEILYLSGFKSKSTFNRVFKKYTGQTPSKYRKNIK